MMIDKDQKFIQTVGGALSKEPSIRTELILRGTPSVHAITFWSQAGSGNKSGDEGLNDASLIH
jgi:hypothetical protein